MSFIQLAKVNKAITEFKKLNQEEQKEFCDTLGLKDDFPERWTDKQTRIINNLKKGGF